MCGLIDIWAESCGRIYIIYMCVYYVFDKTTQAWLDAAIYSVAPKCACELK